MLTRLVGYLLPFILGLAALGVLIWWLQPRLIFFPSSALLSAPSDWGMDYQDVHFGTEDGVMLHGWLLEATRRRDEPPRVLLFFHGNAGNISHRGDSTAIFNDLGLDVLIIDYRGFGQSEGSPSERGLYQDSQAAWRWLTQERGVPQNEIVIFGRSLGGAVATHLAARTQPAGLIVESSFDHLSGLARTHYPLLSRLVPLRYEFPVADEIASVSSPILILHSPEDRIAPYQLGRRLFATASPPKAFVQLRGGHNDGFLRSQPRYQEALASFLDSLAYPKQQPNHTIHDGHDDD
jgi:fermentation-respiration switch protein FrsA (DUF1100 family)